MEAVPADKTSDPRRWRVTVAVAVLCGAAVGAGAAVIASGGDRDQQQLFCHMDGWLGHDGESWHRGEGCRWVDADGDVIPGQPDPRCYTAEMLVVSCDDSDAIDQASDDAILGERHPLAG